jgi:hypothetical protein
MTEQTTTQTLKVGDRVHVAIPDFIREAHDFKYGPEDCFMRTFYGSTGTVVSTHMVEERLPAYARVFFESIDGDQMLRRDRFTLRDDGVWTTEEPNAMRYSFHNDYRPDTPAPFAGRNR